MHTIGVGGAAPRDSLARFCAPYAGRRRNLTFGVSISRRQGETCGKNSETENRRRTELPVHQWQATRTEKQKRQDIASPH
jgi:hypothetical protein